jgi:hypothetical protein
MALKPKQPQVTANITQANAIIERIHKVVNDILSSFDLENNHEIQKKIIHLITSLNQLNGY